MGNRALVGCFGVLVLMLLCFHGQVTAQPGASALVIDDCVKCHPGVVSEMSGKGGQHKTAVGCFDCHREHPPQGADTMAACSLCHDPGGNRHYALTACTGCHNPHAPLAISFDRAGEVRLLCASCHPDAGDSFADYPSSHAELDCKECHARHRQSPACLDCHDAHDAGMSDARDCLRCHRPHMPTVVRYQEDLPAAFCAPCHAEQYEALQKNTLKHNKLSCAFCHRVQHKSLPDCGTCHGQPHAAVKDKNAAACQGCHANAHALTKPAR